MIGIWRAMIKMVYKILKLFMNEKQQRSFPAVNSPQQGAGLLGQTDLGKPQQEQQQ